jgi:hypothetical protein
MYANTSQMYEMYGHNYLHLIPGEKSQIRYLCCARARCSRHPDSPRTVSVSVSNGDKVYHKYWGGRGQTYTNVDFINIVVRCDYGGCAAYARYPIVLLSVPTT